jgi:hypothetical protein
VIAATSAIDRLGGETDVSEADVMPNLSAGTQDAVPDRAHPYVLALGPQRPPSGAIAFGELSNATFELTRNDLGGRVKDCDMRWRRIAWPYERAHQADAHEASARSSSAEDHSSKP